MIEITLKVVFAIIYSVAFVVIGIFIHKAYVRGKVAPVTK